MVRRRQTCESLPNARALEAVPRAIGVLAFDREAAEVHGDLRHALRHNPIGERDLLLASIAFARGLTVVTANVREFRRVPGLAVEDWGM